MSKPTTYYCVFDYLGGELWWTIDHYRKKSIEILLEGTDSDWKEAKRLGYTVRRVQIILVEK
jgi:hypothetical protein